MVPLMVLVTVIEPDPQAAEVKVAVSEVLRYSMMAVWASRGSMPVMSTSLPKSSRYAPFLVSCRRTTNQRAWSDSILAAHRLHLGVEAHSAASQDAEPVDAEENGATGHEG